MLENQLFTPFKNVPVSKIKRMNTSKDLLIVSGVFGFLFLIDCYLYLTLNRGESKVFFTAD